MAFETPDQDFDGESLATGDLRSEGDERGLESEAPSLPSDVSQPRSWFRRVVLPGGEALFWVFLALFSLFIGGGCGAIAFALYRIVFYGSDGFDQSLLTSEGLLPMIIGSQVFLVGFSIAGVLLRYGARTAEVIGLRRLCFFHVAAVLGITIPLQFLAHTWATLVGDLLRMVGLDLSVEDYLETMQNLATSAPLGVVWLLIALSPAIGEELIFRGLIGNTLVRNWGVVRGVLVTSLLFGLIHMTPVQVVAVIPLGLAMHYVYLTTRSFWAPMLLHLANNSLALFMLTQSLGTDAIDPEIMSAYPSPEVMIASAITLVGWVICLWQTRRYVESKTEQGQERLRYQMATPTTYLLSVISVAGFLALAKFAFFE